jgi:hypothetical protein
MLLAEISSPFDQTLMTRNVCRWKFGVVETFNFKIAFCVNLIPTTAG